MHRPLAVVVSARDYVLLDGRDQVVGVHTTFAHDDCSKYRGCRSAWSSTDMLSQAPKKRHCVFQKKKATACEIPVQRWKVYGDARVRSDKDKRLRRYEATSARPTRRHWWVTVQ